MFTKENKKLKKINEFYKSLRKKVYFFLFNSRLQLIFSADWYRCMLMEIIIDFLEN